MVKRSVQFNLDPQFSAARRAAILAARNANVTRVTFRGEYVTVQPSKLSRLLDVIKGVLAI